MGGGDDVSIPRSSGNAWQPMLGPGSARNRARPADDQLEEMRPAAASPKVKAGASTTVRRPRGAGNITREQGILRRPEHCRQLGMSRSASAVAIRPRMVGKDEGSREHGVAAQRVRRHRRARIFDQRFLIPRSRNIA